MASNDLFQWKSRDFINLRKWYKKAPRQFAASTGMLLNNFAFGSRLVSLEIIDRGMLVRSPGFVKSRVQVKKSHFRMPIESQVSEFGSVFANDKGRKARFTGWVEQELGARKARKHYAALGGRGGAKSGRIKRRFRLDKPFVNPDRFPKRRGFKGKNRNHRIAIMLRTLDRMKYSAPFIITGHTKIPSGVYRFTGGRTGFDQRKIEALQFFGKPRRPTKRVRWMRGGTKLYFSRTNIKREWGKVAERQLKRRGLR